MNQTTSLYAQNALAKHEAGRPLTQNETRRVERLAAYARSYRPLGTAPSQLDDRLHEIVNLGGMPPESFGLKKLTLQVCISGVVKSVDFYVARDPY